MRERDHANDDQAGDYPDAPIGCRDCGCTLFETLERRQRVRGRVLVIRACAYCGRLSRRIEPTTDNPEDWF